MQLHLNPAFDLTPGQWFTPEWAAQELVDRFFPDLGPGDKVLEPSAGKGAFLKAVGSKIDAFGIELDPALAAECEANTGRPVICGDFLTLNPSFFLGVTAIVGNPPFGVPLVTRFLKRSLEILPPDGRCGLILPSYMMQTHGRVVEWMQDWSMQVELIPRRLFPRLRLPLNFVLFTKNGRQEHKGLGLYQQAVEVSHMSKPAQHRLDVGSPRVGVWVALVSEVMTALGGQASLEMIYRAIAPRRPTPNVWWKEKVRQVLQQHFERVSSGVWKIPETGIAEVE